MEDYLFGIGEPYFGSSQLTSHHMSTYEEQAFCSCKYEFVSTVNPTKLIRELTQCHLVPKQACKTVMHLEQKGLDRERICYLLFKILPLFSNLQNLVICLNRCKYNTLATMLFWNLFKVRTKALVVIQKISLDQRPGLREFSRKLKRIVHNAPFENRNLFLRRLAKIYVKRIEKEHDPYKRQTYADKYITIIAAEIDVQAIKFDTNLYNSGIFSHIKYIISETSNTLVTDIGYYGRLSNAYAIAGKYSDSEDMLKEARCRSNNIGPGIELFNLLYTEVYVRLWQFESFPSSDLRDALMFWGRLGLKSLEGDDTYSVTVWKRNLIIRMVFCLLGLGNRGNVIGECVVDEHCTEEACRLLEDFERYLDGIETRRMMLYDVAKARLFEIKETNYLKCYEYLTKAKQHAEKGRFEELCFIKEYYIRIANMIEQPIGKGTSGAFHVLSSSDLFKQEVSSDRYIFNPTILHSPCTTPHFHSLRLQYEVPIGNYNLNQSSFSIQSFDSPLGQEFEETNKFAMMQSPSSAPSFHSFRPHRVETGNLVNVQSSPSTPSFHSFRPHRVGTGNLVNAQSSPSTPSFHSFRPYRVGTGNLVNVQSSPSTPSFHSFRPHRVGTGNLVNVQSSPSTPSFHSFWSYSEGNGNALTSISLPMHSTTSFQRCKSRSKETINYVMSHSSSTTPSFYSYSQQDESLGNYVMLQPFSSESSFKSLRLHDDINNGHVLMQTLKSCLSDSSQAEESCNCSMLQSYCSCCLTSRPLFRPTFVNTDHHVTTQSSFSTPSFHSFRSHINDTALKDNYPLNSDFVCGNSDIFYFEREEPSGCSQPDTFSLQSNTCTFNDDTGLPTSVKNYISDVLSQNNNTDRKLIYDTQRCDQSELRRNNGQTYECKLTDKSPEINRGIIARHFTNSTFETSCSCAGITKTSMCNFTDSLFEAGDSYNKLLEAALLKYTNTDKASSEHVNEPSFLQQNCQNTIDSFSSSISEYQNLVSFHDVNPNVGNHNVGFTDQHSLQCSNVNVKFIPESVRIPSFERPPLSGCSTVGNPSPQSLANRIHQANNNVFYFEKQLIRKLANSKCQNNENTEFLSISSDDLFGE